MAENGRVDMIIDQLNRMEHKLDQLVRDTNDDFDTVERRVSKVEQRVSRIEGVGGALQVIWGGLIAWLGGHGGGGSP